MKTQTPQMVDLMPRNDKELEAHVIGALLAVEDAAFVVLPLIREPNVFYYPEHAEIYKAVKKMQTEAQAITLMTVRHYLTKAGTLQTVGGDYYLAHCMGKVSSTTALENQCLYLVEMFISRQLATTCADIASTANDPTKDAMVSYQDAQNRIDAIGEQITMEPVRDWLTIIKDVTIDIERLSDGKQVGSGIRTGFEKMDEITGGWQPGQFIIMAARPGMGKTAMAVKHVCDIARQNMPVGVFELEMRDVDFAKRIIANESNIHANSLFVHGLNPNGHDYWPGYWKTVSAIEPWPLHLKTRPGLTLYDFQIEARKMVQRNGVKMIFIDYMQLLRMGKESRTINNREQEISTISRTIKQTAMELNVPIVALSQLSREVEKRSDKRPRLSDLRESGSLEQDADIVLFIHRDEYYNADNAAPGMAEYIIEKHRNGQTGCFDIGYDANRVKFYDTTQQQPTHNAF